MKKKTSPSKNAGEPLDCFSVHEIPAINASVAFVPKTPDVFRDSDSPTTKSIDGQDYVAWGADDSMPYEIISLIEADETLATCQVFNSELCYGSGLRYCSQDASPAVRSEVDEFLFDNQLPEYFLGVAQDMKHFNFAISVIILNSDGSKIVSLHRKAACYCRFAPKNKSGVIPYVLYGNFRCTAVEETKVEKIPLLDPASPWRDLRMRMGRLSRPDGRRRMDRDRKFAVLTRFPGVDSMYYPIPHYAALFRGSWYKIKQHIGAAKLAKLRNAAPIKYVIEISRSYWENQFMTNRIVGSEKQREFMRRKKESMMEFLTNVENTGNVLFTSRSMAIDGKGETSDIVVSRVDSATKEGGDWESDIAEAVNMVCFVMRVHSNLVGSVPGKAQTNNSGSDKRELYTIAQALQKPYHDLLFRPHEMIIRYNGWTGVHVDCPFIQLTTLDEHSDSKEVSVSGSPETIKP